MWLVPVASCTAGDPAGLADAARRQGYVFVSGFDQPMKEGTMIRPSGELCGYEIIFVSERAAWFRAVFDDAGTAPAGKLKTGRPLLAP